MAIDLARVKGLCFDVDGTLSDTDDRWVAVIVRLLKPVCFLFKRGDPTLFARWLVMVTESPMNAVYHWLDRHSLDDNFARLFDRMSRKSRHKQIFWLMRNAPELLALLQERYPQTIVSARDDRTTELFLTQFELDKFFRAVVTAQTCEYTKPFPHPVLHAAQAMGLKPEECVMIGDTTVDILAGKRAGAQTIGLLCGFGSEDELLRVGADLIVHDLEELKRVFLLESEKP
jgi:HAD superfamily hydrolase (TIGR01549 family)